MTRFPETADAPSGAGGAPAALAAFLRGVERRGMVLGQCQCGDDAAGEHALAAAMRAFGGHAAALPMADWPLRFWSLLAATPQLRRPSTGAAWPDDLQALRTPTADDRLALLLRIAAGLDEGEAARVLGVDVQDYRQALARACPRDADGQPDAAAWRALAETVQARIRGLDPAQAERLARLRESVAEGRPQARPTPPAATSAGRRCRTAAIPRGLRRILIAVALVVAVAIVAWLLWPRMRALPAQTGPGEAPQVLVEPLPADRSARPGAVPSASEAGDDAMLADPDLAIARDADFYAWLAAGQPLPRDESEAPAATTAPLPSDTLETVDAE